MKVCANNRKKKDSLLLGPTSPQFWTVQLQLALENKQCSAAGLLKTAKGEFQSPLFPFGTTQIYLVIKSGKAPHHLKRIGK